MPKIRTDFVTNSSSSSFVLAFNSEDEIIDIVKSNLRDYMNDEALRRVIADIYEGITTTDVALMLYQDYCSSYEFEQLEFEGQKVYEYPYSERRDPSSPIGIFLSECKQKSIREFAVELKAHGLVSIVKYEDCTQLESELEHYVMPQFKNTIKIISHH